MSEQLPIWLANTLVGVFAYGLARELFKNVREPDYQGMINEVEALAFELYPTHRTYIYITQQRDGVRIAELRKVAHNRVLIRVREDSEETVLKGLVREIRREIADEAWVCESVGRYSRPSGDV